MSFCGPRACLLRRESGGWRTCAEPLARPSWLGWSCPPMSRGWLTGDATNVHVGLACTLAPSSLSDTMGCVCVASLVSNAPKWCGLGGVLSMAVEASRRHDPVPSAGGVCARAASGWLFARLTGASGVVMVVSSSAPAEVAHTYRRVIDSGVPTFERPSLASLARQPAQRSHRRSAGSSYEEAGARCAARCCEGPAREQALELVPTEALCSSIGIGGSRC